MRRVILLFIALFPAVSWAEQMTINQRPLTDSEYASYRSLEDQIRCHPGDDLAGVRSLLDRIAASTLFDTAKDCLVDQLGIETLGEAKDPMSLAGRFLASSDERLQRLAMGWLFGNTDEWASDPEVRERIRDLAMDETISGDTRLIAFSLFASVDQFFEVERAALALAREHANANLAHRAAQVIVSVEMDDEAAIARLARSDIRAVREEARGVGCAYAASMLSIAKDATEPAWVRGDAIEAFGRCPASDRTEAALIELLEPRFWFFGATGQHFPIHSLALVIPLLAERPSPRAHARLLTFWPQTETLRSGEREYVQWVLANALGEHREIFAGPVHP